MARTSARIEEVPGVYPERLTLIRYRRGKDCPTWEAKVLARRMKRPVIVSLRTTDLAEAHRVAIERLRQIETNLEAGLGPLDGSAERRRRPARSFGQAAEEVVAALEAQAREAEEQFGKRDGRLHKYRCKINIIRNRLIPQFGATRVADIDGLALKQYAKSLEVLPRGGSAPRKVRLVPGKGPVKPPPRSSRVSPPGKKPTKGTVGNLAAVFGLVMRHAEDKNWIEQDAIPTIPRRMFNHGERRPGFSDVEVRTILETMDDDWVLQGRTDVAREGRALLRCWTVTCICSGIRPGVEMDTMRFRHISTDRDRDGDDYVCFRVPKISAKTGRITGGRDVVAHLWGLADLRAALDQLRKIKGAHKPDDPVFANRCGMIPGFGKLFHAHLSAIGLLEDPVTGAHRSAYSLRHYYATKMLVDAQVEIRRLARNMGTSVAMIERYYDGATARAVAHTLTGKPAGKLARPGVPEAIPEPARLARPRTVRPEERLHARTCNWIGLPPLTLDSGKQRLGLPRPPRVSKAGVSKTGVSKAQMMKLSEATPEEGFCAPECSWIGSEPLSCVPSKRHLGLPRVSEPESTPDAFMALAASTVHEEEHPHDRMNGLAMHAMFDTGGTPAKFHRQVHRVLTQAPRAALARTLKTYPAGEARRAAVARLHFLAACCLMYHPEERRKVYDWLNAFETEPQ